MNIANRFLDLAGQRFGELVAIRRTSQDNQHQTYWLCRCSCGKFLDVRLGNLRSGNSTSCGHNRIPHVREGCHRRKRDLSAKRFGRLFVLKETDVPCMWWCRCDCGDIHVVSSSNLLKGKIRSCGCLKREHLATLRSIYIFKHGLTGTKEYERTRHTIRRERKRALDSQWTPEMQLALEAFFPACVACGSSKRLTTDHVLPLSKGNGLVPGNAVILCTNCNSRKRTKRLEQLPDVMRTNIERAAIAFKEHWENIEKEKETRPNVRQKFLSDPPNADQ
jgi:5-methylcytosine-specific restriction endonuclease McrA